MNKNVSLNIPYPTLDGVRADKRTVALVRRAYVGRHGELKAVLQYFYHYLYFNKLGCVEVAKIILGIAQCEMRHLEILGQLLTALGDDPVFSPVSPWGTTCDFVSGISYSKTAQKMIMDDISSEMASVCEYESIIERIKDERVQAVLKRITLDEQLHIKVLKDALSDYKIS